MIKGVAFDLEGTVVDVEKLHFDGFILASKEGGLEVDFETIVRDIPLAIGGGDQRIAEGLQKMSGDRLTAQWIRERKMFYYNEQLAKVELKPRPGFRELFDKIVSAGIKVAIGSLTPKTQAHVLLERSGVGKLFPKERIVLLEDVKNKKPAPDVYIETANRMGIATGQQLVFEDSFTGLKAAKAAGSRCIVMPIYHHGLSKFAEEGATNTFLHWGDVNISVLKA